MQINLTEAAMPLVAVFAMLLLFAWPATNPRRWRRFRAATIDAAIAGGIATLIWLSGNLEHPVTELTARFTPVLGAILAAIYLLARDCAHHDGGRFRSLAKRRLHVRIRTHGDHSMHIGRAATRNLPLLAVILIPVPGLAVPVAGLLILEGLLARFTPSGRRLGDHLASTVVSERQ